MDNMEAGPSGLTDEEKKKAIDSDKDAKIPEKK